VILGPISGADPVNSTGAVVEATAAVNSVVGVAEAPAGSVAPFKGK